MRSHAHGMERLLWEGKQPRQVPRGTAFDDCSFASKARQAAASDRHADITANAL